MKDVSGGTSKRAVLEQIDLLQNFVREMTKITEWILQIQKCEPNNERSERKQRNGVLRYAWLALVLTKLYSNIYY